MSFDVGMGRCTEITDDSVTVKLDSVLVHKWFPAEPWRRPGLLLVGARPATVGPGQVPGDRTSAPLAGLQTRATLVSEWPSSGRVQAVFRRRCAGQAVRTGQRQAKARHCGVHHV